MLSNQILPNFIIIGERRCGTTSLYHWLSSHKDIYLHPKADYGFFLDEQLDSRTKPKEEIDHQIWEKKNTLESYAKEFQGGKNQRIRGHKCADLFFWKPAHERMKEFIPYCKFIVILRNPIKRAWSHYWNEVGKGREKLSFTDAINQEESRSKENGYNHFHLSYLERGFYYQNLKQFLETFSRENLLVITTEEMHQNPIETLHKVYEFFEIDASLGLEKAGARVNENWITVPKKWATLPVIRSVASGQERLAEAIITRVTSEGYKRRYLRNKSQSIFRQPTSEMKMSEEIKSRLLDIYKQEISEIENFLGRNLTDWTI